LSFPHHFGERKPDFSVEIARIGSFLNIYFIILKARDNQIDVHTKFF
jgi:hypothetical protein